MAADVASRANQLGLPSCQANDRPWHYKHVLSQAQVASVRAWEQHVRTSHGLERQDRPNVFCSVTQRPGVRGNATPICPPLLQRSQIWSVAKQRLMLAIEKFEVQGFNVFDTTCPLAPFLEHLRSLSKGTLSALAGNGMHLPTMASLLAFTLLGTERL